MNLIIYILIIFCVVPVVHGRPSGGHKIHVASSRSLDQLKKELKNRPSPLMSALTNKRFQRIYRLLNNKANYAKALTLITQLEGVVKNRPYPLNRVYLLKAQVYLGQDNYPQALLFYKKSLDMKKLSYSEHLSVLFDMATIYLFQDKINKSRKLIDQWFYLADTIIPAGYMLKAVILVEQNKKKEALKFILNAIHNTSSPKESWLAFAASLHIEMGDYAPATHLLKRLTILYPEKQKYWKQLSIMYANKNQDILALSMIELADKLKTLQKSQDILHLAGLLMYQGQPFKAGSLLEKAMALGQIKKTQRHYEILGDCWVRAEEVSKALSAYRLAEPQAKNGLLFAKIAGIYLDQRKWDRVIHYFQLALQKGKIKRPEQVYISMGVAYFHLKKYDQAVKSFEQVIMTEAKGQWIKMAREWINYVSRENPHYASKSHQTPL